MMNSIQLSGAARKDPCLQRYFKGVFSSDCLPRQRLKLPAALISNLDPKSKEGSHWVAFYLSPNGRGEYFDSYGHPPLLESYKDFLQINCQSWVCNQRMLQNPATSSCGQHCLYYLCLRARGVPVEKMYGTIYGSDLLQNDTNAVDFVNTYFNMDTEVFDVDFVVNQICKVLNTQ